MSDEAQERVEREFTFTHFSTWDNIFEPDRLPVQAIVIMEHGVISVHAIESFFMTAAQTRELAAHLISLADQLEGKA